MGRPSKINDGLKSSIQLLRQKGMGIKQIAKKVGMDICLTAAAEICESIVDSPYMLTSGDFSTPILWISAYENIDPRMFLVLREYDTHASFGVWRKWSPNL